MMKTHAIDKVIAWRVMMIMAADLNLYNDIDSVQSRRTWDEVARMSLLMWKDGSNEQKSINHR